MCPSHCSVRLLGGKGDMLCLRADRLWQDLHNERRCWERGAGHVLPGWGGYFHSSGLESSSFVSLCVLLRDLLRSVIRFTESTGTIAGPWRCKAKCKHCGFDYQTSGHSTWVHVGYLLWVGSAHHQPEQHQCRLLPLACHPTDITTKRQEDSWKNQLHWSGWLWKRGWYNRSE